MYLKNIEVQGFKSFAQKINFEFHNGITGIKLCIRSHYSG